MLQMMKHVYKFQTTKKKTTPKKEVVLTRDDFFKLLDKAIQPVKKLTPAKGKKKTSA